MTASYGDWEPVIGLEVHVQLMTRTKLFCGCRTSFGDPPNTHVCPNCAGLPGALPVLNDAAVRLAVRAALALGCTVHEESVFSRKNYFYPDLPKGYQISQFDRPLATDGVLEVEVQGQKLTCGIQRIHMEEDAGKTIHGKGSTSVVDLNRAGTPLIEIVGHPDMGSAAQAGAYLRKLRDILVFAGVSDGNLEQGSFRADSNVSVRKKGDPQLGTRTELKNINSFKFVEEAIDLEIRRQIRHVEGGGRVRMETRGYAADRKETYSMRDKENEAGYRYFPEPDLRPLRVEASSLAVIQKETPELPEAKRARYVAELGITPQAAAVLTSHREIARLFEEGLALVEEAMASLTDTERATKRTERMQKLANLIQAEVLRDAVMTASTADFGVTARQLVDLQDLVEEGTISGKQAKEVYAKLGRNTCASPREVVKELGLAVIRDEGALLEIARGVVAANAKQAASFRAGKEQLLGFFVGQIMKQTGGSASPQLASDLARRALAESAAEGALADGPDGADRGSGNG